MGEASSTGTTMTRRFNQLRFNLLTTATPSLASYGHAQYIRWRGVQTEAHAHVEILAATHRITHCAVMLQDESEEEEEEEDGDDGVGDKEEEDEEEEAEEEEETDLYRLTVLKLKSRLRAMGQLVGGRKQDLIDRLTRAMDEADNEADDGVQQESEEEEEGGEEQDDWDDEARSHPLSQHPQRRVLSAVYWLPEHRTRAMRARARARAMRARVRAGARARARARARQRTRVRQRARARRTTMRRRTTTMTASKCVALNHTSRKVYHHLVRSGALGTQGAACQAFPANPRRNIWVGQRGRIV